MMKTPPLFFGFCFFILATASHVQGAIITLESTATSAGTLLGEELSEGDTFNFSFSLSNDSFSADNVYTLGTNDLLSIDLNGQSYTSFFGSHSFNVSIASGEVEKVWGTVKVSVPAPEYFEAIVFSDIFLFVKQSSTLSGSYTINTSLVPVPAAAWLFGSALVGLVGAKRKK